MKTWIVLQKRDKNVNYETDRLLTEGGLVAYPEFKMSNKL